MQPHLALKDFIPRHQREEAKRETDINTQTSHDIIPVVVVQWIGSSSWLALDLRPDKSTGRRWPGSVPHGRDLPLGDDVDTAEIWHTFADGGTEVCAPE